MTDNDLKNLEYNQYHQILCNSKKSVLDHTIGSLYGFENIYIKDSQTVEDQNRN